MATAGYLLVWLGWAIGVVTFVVGCRQLPASRAARREGGEPFPRAARVVITTGSVAVVATLVLPWLRGISSSGSEVIELRGWAALDLWSAVFVVAACVLMPVLAAGARAEGAAFDLAGVLLCLATCVSLVVVGNLFIRLGEPGPDALFGFGFAAVATLVPVAGAMSLGDAERQVAGGG